jgi:hypothetical protein
MPGLTTRQPPTEITPTVVKKTPTLTATSRVITDTLSTAQVTLTAAAKEEEEEKNQPPAEPQLAFLREKNLWLLDTPDGEARQITETGDLLSYAWSPDGERLATYNGHELCFVNEEGSSESPCIDLKLGDNQAKIERHIVWSPDQKTIVLWNPVNPWDEGAIGWIIVTLDDSNSVLKIEDPVTWGVSLAPDNESGGFTGEPVFLDDNSLLGTMTHRWLCGSGGCHYQLFQFDFDDQKFKPYPNKADEGWSEGRALLISNDRSVLTNFGTFYTDCESYVTFVDFFELESGKRQAYNFGNEAMNWIALSSDSSYAVIAHNSGCSVKNPEDWAMVCGLSTGYEIYAIQTWNLSDDNRTDLLPGINPVWSPDNEWIAFRSCLEPKPGGGWVTSKTGPPSIYLIHPNGSGVTQVSKGVMPSWRPQENEG